LRTMVDLARSIRFLDAVVTLDAGLRVPFLLPSGAVTPPLTKDELLAAVDRIGAARGCRGARRAAQFADGRSGSAGETVSRVNIFVCGFPAPDLQVVYLRPDGGEDIVDFAWEAKHTVQRQPLLGEFDGKMKYTRAQYMHGRAAEEVVWDEKVREDRLRRPGRGVVRWLWADALSPQRLRAVLLEAGLRLQA
jgi:hypothetical protein